MSMLIQQDLYFGRNIGTTGRITRKQFQKFLNDVVTHRSRKKKVNQAAIERSRWKIESVMELMYVQLNHFAEN
jgi:hypothetical protein